LTSDAEACPRSLIAAVWRLLLVSSLLSAGSGLVRLVLGGVFAGYGLDGGVRILVENRRGGKGGRGWIRSR